MKIRTIAAAVLSLALLAGCGGGGEEKGSKPQDQDEVSVEAGVPAAEVEVVYDWRKVSSVYYEAYFRVVRVNGQCLIEEYHYESGGTSIVLAPGACER